MKLIIVLILCLVGLGVWILGCDQVNGFDDNPIVVVGDTAYVNVPVDAGVALFGGSCGVDIYVTVRYDDYEVKYTNREAGKAKKVVLFFENCPPRPDV